MNYFPNPSQFFFPSNGYMINTNHLTSSVASSVASSKHNNNINPFNSHARSFHSFISQPQFFNYFSSKSVKSLNSHAFSGSNLLPGLEDNSFPTFEKHSISNLDSYSFSDLKSHFSKNSSPPSCLLDKDISFDFDFDFDFPLSNTNGQIPIHTNSLDDNKKKLPSNDFSQTIYANNNNNNHNYNYDQNSIPYIETFQKHPLYCTPQTSQEYPLSSPLPDSDSSYIFIQDNTYSLANSFFDTHFSPPSLSHSSSSDSINSIFTNSSTQSFISSPSFDTCLSSPLTPISSFGFSFDSKISCDIDSFSESKNQQNDAFLNTYELDKNLQISTSNFAINPINKKRKRSNSTSVSSNPRKPRWLPEDDNLVLFYKNKCNYTWKSISRAIGGRHTWQAIQMRYLRVLKNSTQSLNNPSSMLYNQSTPFSEQTPDPNNFFQNLNTEIKSKGYKKTKIKSKDEFKMKSKPKLKMKNKIKSKLKIEINNKINDEIQSEKNNEIKDKIQNELNDEIIVESIN